jgi:hypothetical protein
MPVNHTICRHLVFVNCQNVGVAGFEPATLWSQTRCANRAALHPVLPAEALAKVGFPYQNLTL